MLPTGPPIFATTRAMMPEKAGDEAEVPPKAVSAELPLVKARTGTRVDAATATSGTYRWLSAGTPGAVCQGGFAYRIEAPPPEAHSGPHRAPFSFQASSGM